MMNNLQHRLLCVLGASALLMGLAAVQDLQPRSLAASVDLPVEAAVSAPAPAYLVRELDGVVAVFSGDGSELLQLTDSPVSALPTSDRASLRSGIAVADDQALAMLLEDYQ